MSNPIEPRESKHYLFVIDTDQYSGNFERKMCAYITGQIGDCEVGDEQAELAKREIPEVVAKLEELIESVPDEYGCHRPCSIFSRSGWFNHGMGGIFREGHEEKALAHYKKEVEIYNRRHIKQINKIKTGTNGWTAEAKKREIKRFQAEINKANSLKTVSKYPAYMSVAIYFNSIPDSKLLEIMKERAKNIELKGIVLDKFGPKIKIEGFRLFEQKTTYKELKL